MPETLTAATLTLTLAGAPLPTAVDVYRLAVPAIELEQPADQQSAEDEQPSRTDGWQRGMGVGFLAGCAFGLFVLNVLIEDRAEGGGVNVLACASAGAYGAGLGAAVGAIVP